MKSNYNEIFDFMSDYLSKSDIYAAKTIAKISMFILKYRQEVNMTQKEFAKKMGVTQAMVSKWESSEYNFTIETIAHICEKLNTTFDIEFKPESEYLANISNNNYDKLSINQNWEAKGNIVPFVAA